MIFIIQTGDDVAGLDVTQALFGAGISHTIISKTYDESAIKGSQMDISRVELIAAARQSAKDAHDKQSITPRHVNNLIKNIFQLCDAYEQLVTSYEHMQRRLDAAKHGVQPTDEAAQNGVASDQLSHSTVVGG